LQTLLLDDCLLVAAPNARRDAGHAFDAQYAVLEILRVYPHVESYARLDEAVGVRDVGISNDIFGICYLVTRRDKIKWRNEKVSQMENNSLSAPAPTGNSMRTDTWKKFSLPFGPSLAESERSSGAI
jgi:hypothetical protein